MVHQVPGASRLNDFKNLTLIGKGWPRAVARRAPAVLHSVAGWLLLQQPSQKRYAVN